MVADDQPVESGRQKGLDGFSWRTDNRLAFDIERSIEENRQAAPFFKFIQQFPQTRIVLAGDGLGPGLVAQALKGTDATGGALAGR